MRKSDRGGFNLNGNRSLLIEFKPLVLADM